MWDIPDENVGYLRYKIQDIKDEMWDIKDKKMGDFKGTRCGILKG